MACVPAQASPLVIRAGRLAAQRLREGWDWNLFDVMLGASAGPRWLVLSAIDQILPGLLARDRVRPLHLLGSSSGAWRFVSYCHEQPHRSIAHLEQAYIDADWTHNRPLPERASSADSILQRYLRGRESEVFNHDSFRLHVITSLCRGPLRSERWIPQIAGLLLAAALFGWWRKGLGLLAQRALFSDPRSPLPAQLDDITSHRWPLHKDNLGRVILASGAIPLLLPGQYEVPDGPRGGCLRDGGLLDYHLDCISLTNPGLILYPHFCDRLIGGWWESVHPTRSLPPQVHDRLVLVHPTPAWVASLPGGKVPGTADAQRYGEAERRRRWIESTRRGQELGAALANLERLPIEPL